VAEGRKHERERRRKRKRACGWQNEYGAPILDFKIGEGGKRVRERDREE